jgi:hypothetical protein
MKRANEERPRTLRVWRQHLVGHGPGPVDCVCELQPGRFRKGERVGGCSCYYCNYEKLNNIPKKYQRLADISCEEQLDECGHVPHVSISKFRKGG